MLKLIFFTSNRVKLAHARHWAENFDLIITGFRQRTYHADYDEPKLSSRDEVLAASYNNALAQCKRAGINVENTAFILEDTSVTIHGLSSDDEDIPGVNIKYWMQDMSFTYLDMLLKENGNDRRAEVCSNVLLHAPHYYREILGLDIDFRIFSSKQGGIVVDKEVEFETNLVYPWLDNQTFNQWFQPFGADKPLGALDIELADKLDFRRGSFLDTFRFLGAAPRLPKSRNQFELSFDSRPNIILCGYTCSGKTTASQYMANAYDYQHVEASDFMQMSFFRRHGVKNSIRTSNFAEIALREKPLIVAQQVLQYIEEEWTTPAVVSGFRSIMEVNYLVENIQFSSRSCIVVFLQADFKERYRRLKNRMRAGDAVSIAEFGEKDNQQKRMGLDEIKNNPTTRLWVNDGSLEDYYRFLDTQLPKDFESNIDLLEIKCQFCNQLDVKLEDSILVTLLDEWSDVEVERKYFTTTEIAAKINTLFSNIQPKHKDNVSRYFNQDFHSYFEVFVLPKEGICKYRLSNTGHSRALHILKNFKSYGAITHT